MTAVDEQARSIFLSAMERAPGEWPAFLEEACAGNADLRANVEQLLRAHEAMGSIHGGGGHRPVITIDQQPPERPGTQIGPYKLLQQIGEGGMGVVYMAEQTEPVQRKVALKVIKPGMDSRQVIARFEAERQALAMMDHVNIARVFDGGATEAGRPCFVMELVHGVPITKYCDDNRLTPRQRLELFVPVCQAIQHAHQKGIIHRDIKPSNVMVTLYDGKPVPKVIDFGVAKATEQKLTERTLFTQYGTMVGTLEYMSPEQAEMSALGVDTRSDIYSLGVLLYELLTGSTPVSSKRMKEAAYAEILRLIKEEEPPKPSTRLSESGESLASISAQRHTEPAKLSKLMRGELDWIVMKTLEKDRNRRYETAKDFAADVQRYLGDEPVQACPPSALYRFRKFARRNKAAIGVAGMVLFFLVLLGSGAGWALRDREAREQEIAQETARKLALTEQGIRQALDRGTKSRAELHAILKKPGGVQQLLNQPARWELLIKTAQGELAQARRSAVRAEGSLDAECTQAMDKLEQQLTSDQADYVLALRLEKIRLDQAIWVEGRFDFRTAADEYSKAFAGFAVLNDDPVAVAARLRSSPIKDQLVAALDEWAWIAFHFRNQGLAEQLLAVARHAAPDPAWGDRLRQPKVWREQEALGKLVAEAPTAGLSPQILLLVGSLLRDNKPLQESWLRQAQAEHPADFGLSFILAFALLETNPVEAAGFNRVALAVRPGTCVAYNNLGIALVDQKKLPEAIAAYLKAIEIDPQSTPAYTNLGVALRKLGKVDEAIAAYLKAIEIDPKYASAYNNLGAALDDQKKLPEAIAAYHKALEIDPKCAGAYSNLGHAFRAQKKLPEALAAYHKALEIDPKCANAHTGLGHALFLQHKLPEAFAWYTKAIELHPNYAPAWEGRGWAHMRGGQLEKALADQSKAIELEPKEPQYWNGRSGTYLKLGQLDKAVADSAKAIELDPKFAPAWFNRGEAHRMLDQPDKAAGDYRMAIGLKTLPPRETPLAYRNLALVLDKLGNKEEARKQYEYLVELDKTAVELAPKDPMAWQNLGWDQYRAGAWKDSIEALEMSCKLQEGSTGDSYQWIVLALAHAKLAAQEGVPEEERPRHRTEARRRYEQADKDLSSKWRVRPSDALGQAVWDFHMEATKLIGAKEEKK